MTILFVVATIIIFLTVDWFVRRSRRATEAVKPAFHQPVQVRMPEGIFFAPSHTWLSLFPSGKIRLGVDDFVERLLANPRITFLKKEGDLVRKGDPIFRLNEDGHFLTVRAPISGRILERNAELEQDPGLMRDLMFSSGWAYTIQPDRLTDLKSFFFGDETREWMKNEVARLRDVFAGTDADGNLVPATLQDGGPPYAGSMTHANDMTWKRFEEAFLHVA